MRRERRRAGRWSVLGLAIGLVLVTAGAAVASPRAGAVAQAATLSAAPGTTASPLPPGYALEHFKWVDRTTVDVYYTWDGGACVLDGTDLSGAAPPLSPTVALQSLDASIAEINTSLAGGLTLKDAGQATRDVLCSRDPAHAIVIGYGAIAATGLTFSFGLTSTTTPGWSDLQEARVFLNNTYDFACPGVPAYRDLQHTITHELLHAIGVGHSSDPTAIMAPTGIACATPYVLQPDDLAALAVLYPPPPGATVTPAPSVTTATAFDRAITSSGVNPAVWNGGSVDTLASATSAAGGVSVTVYVGGEAVVLIPGAPSFVNGAFFAAFPTGVPKGTIVLVVR